MSYINNATPGGSGTVTSVSGTANQIAVATGTTTPVISLPSAIVLPGTVNKVTLTGPTTAGTLAFGTDNSTLTLQGTGTVVNRDSTDTLTNKTFDTAGTGNSFKINGTSVSAVTGTGSAVLATSPTLVTPVLGVATVTSINNVGFTAPTTAATFAFNTDNTTQTFQGTGTIVSRNSTDTLQNKTLDSTNFNKIFPVAPQFSTSDTITNADALGHTFATQAVIPANFFTANRVLKLWLGCDLTSSASPTLTLSIKLSGTSIYTSVSLAPTSQTAQSGGCAFMIQGTAAASGSAALMSSVIQGPGVSGAANAPFTKNTLTTQTTGFATNGSLTLTVLAQWGTTTGTNSITLTQMILEALN